MNLERYITTRAEIAMQLLRKMNYGSSAIKVKSYLLNRQTRMQ